MLVAADHGNAVAGGDGKVMCTPCGGCRQRIREFASPDTPILIAGDKGLMAVLPLRRYCLKASGLKISIVRSLTYGQALLFLFGDECR